MKKVIIAFVLIVSTLAISLFGACSVFDKIDDAFNDILGEVESEVESDIEQGEEGGASEESKPVDQYAPTTLGFLLNNLEVNSSELSAGESYTFALNLSNEIGSVGFQYSDFAIEKVGIKGMYVAEKQQIINGTIVKRNEYIVDFDEESLEGMDCDSAHSELYPKLDINWKWFLKAEIVDGALVVEPIHNEKTYLPAAAVRTGVRYQYVEPYYNESGEEINCYFYIDVVEKVSGVTARLYLDF